MVIQLSLVKFAFTYDSLDFRSKYSSVLSQYTKVSQERHALENSIAQFNVELGVENELGGFLENYLKKVTHLYGEKIIDINKIVSAKINHATSQKKREELKSQLETAQEAREQFVQATDELLSTLNYFKNTFANGTYHSEVTGIVGDLNAIPGDLIKQGNPIYTAYYNKRFIEVLFEESSVTYDLNDPVLVSVPEEGWVIGRIVDVGLYSPTLPEEIQPKYRPSGRRRLVRVLIDENYLKNLEMRTLLKVYKPIGMEVACKFLNCKDHLLEDYSTYKKEEGLRPSQDHPY